MNERDTVEMTAPDWFRSMEDAKCIPMDVRPILAEGIDPLDQILARVAQLSPEDILVIEAPFDPLPLRRRLATMGYDNYGTALSEGHWKVFFKQNDICPLPEFPDLPPFPSTWRDGVLEMDLRHLDPPNPMIAILKAIESGQGGDVFTARLMRDPVYLYPELGERHWRAEIVEDTAAGLLMRLEKDHKK
ncbi:hypothetical protein MNBD_ALPHA02-1525 [hydrothermal vent metagenome]|uniref:DUF2249 domain-containing protein n=1 Tax=hydrothermal vent metagenome TaxID=652676 RepID=A0A3B0RVB2_9ZZZZ